MDPRQTRPTDPPGGGDRAGEDPLGGGPPPGGDPLGDVPPEGADPFGWGADYGPPPPPRSNLDFAPLFALLDTLRRGLPGEVQAQFTALVREALLTLRALIDWYLERLDRPRREPRVEDIPID
jgi:hypothetical protein